MSVSALAVAPVRRHARRGRVVIAITAGMAASLGLAAAPPVLEDRPAVADTTIFNSGETSNGAGTRLFAGVTNAAGGFTRQRSPIRFDLAGIPADAEIIAAEVILTLQQAGGAAQDGQIFGLHRIDAAWGEAGSVATGGQGAPAEPGDATWSFAMFPRTAWATPGGDVATAASASLPIGVTPGTAWTFTSAELAADVAAWLADPASNHGWMLIADESVNGSARRFHAREAAEAVRPVLRLTWTAPACGGDLDGSGQVDFGDLLAVLSAFGPCGGCAEDLDGSGAADFGDLLLLLANFGGCVG
ncbi:MAG: DNRLRE domain-containing protein [Planctomycetota bacterium]|jgi:hypothetical protein